MAYAGIGLVWNSVMWVAGGWFFLMACEMFVLGARDFRLPGLGSCLQIAASSRDMREMVWGMAAMIAVIVLLDQFVWRPVIAWADKFKFETVEGTAAPASFALTVLRSSGIVSKLYRFAIHPLGERLTMVFARKTAVDLQAPSPGASPRKWRMGGGAGGRPCGLCWCALPRL